ncbi:amidase [Caballeronia sp. LZ001]|uniref:amidase n=1 Tax=Caballeronia sp. LZ001 TaxID=3038553 RepID=UPI0028667CA7|nr:amidase [Caballeronia sp. LZ001]MDR5804780.1 amidase [Caballeronia sp. LZ001]
MQKSSEIPTLVEAKRQIREGTLSSVDLLAQTRERINANERRVNTFVTQTYESALQTATDVDQKVAAGQPLGSLAGIPYTLKDIIDTAGTKTTGQSRAFASRVPEKDAEVSLRIQSAGGVLMGKAATWEFAHGGPSWDILGEPCRNPWKLTHDPAGSSSGSAAGVAAGFALMSIGSDTGGSIRGPSAYCGVTGLKPTFGRVSRRGVMSNSFSHDHVGPIAWSAADVAEVLQCISGHDPADPDSSQAPVSDYTVGLSNDLSGAVIGVPYRWFDEEVPASSAVRQAFDATLKVFEAMGAKVVSIELPHLKLFEDSKKLIAAVELFAAHADLIRTVPDDLGEVFRVRVMGGALVSGGSYMRAHRLRRELTLAVTAALDKVDVILLPTCEPAPILKPPVAEDFLSGRGYLTPFCCTGHPALAARMGFTSDGLPLSFQIAGKHFDEATVLNFAHRYEMNTEWRFYRPMFASA